jgi:transmembrane sensor
MSNREGQTIREAAVAWFVRLDSPDVSAAEHAEFEAWRGADPAHAAAYAQVERVWSALKGLPVGARDSGEDRSAAPAVRRVGRGRWSMGLVAAAIVLLGLSIAPQLLLRWRADVTTRVGEQRTVSLADGSLAHLDTDSAIAFAESARERRLTLLRGRAEFIVAHAPARPFRVVAGDVRVTALGTTFVVRRLDHEIGVSVIESGVVVDYPSGSERGQVTLGENQRIAYRAGSGVGAVERIDPRMDESWRGGKLIFTDARLGDVVAELDRYHRGHMVLIDSQLRDRHVNGVFAVRDPAAVVRLLETSLGIRSTRLTDYLILLHR